MFDKRSLINSSDPKNTNSTKITSTYHHQVRNSESKELIKPYQSKQKKLITFEAENDQNKDYITRRMQEIRKKYSMNKPDLSQGKSSHLRQPSIKGQLSINKYNPSKQLDSPIQKITKIANQKVLQSDYNSSKLQRDYSKPKITTDCDPRIESIDKINQKIKSILKNISNQEGNQKAIQSKYIPLISSNNSIQKSQQFAYLTKKDISKNYTNQYLHSNAFQETKKKENLTSYSNSKLNSFKIVQNQHYSKQSIWNQSKQFRPRPESQLNIQKRPKIEKQQTQIRPNSGYDKYYNQASNYQALKKEYQNQLRENLPDSQKKIIIQPKDYQIQSKFKLKQVINQTPTSKDETNRLIKNLKKQVQVDENYRNKKYAFKQIKDPNKINILLKSLASLGYHFAEQNLLKQIQITQEEYNPFYTFREDCNYDAIAQAYKEATEHWKNNIKGKYKLDKLMEQGFKDQILGFQKKGFLSVEDFVRMLNNEADNFLRNRDLILIYRRITKKDKLDFKQLIEVVCSSV